jgi:hypothetical protein
MSRVVMTFALIGRCTLLAVIVEACVSAPAARAQGVSADGVAILAHHELLGNPLGGFGVRVWSRPHNGIVAVFAGERLRGSSTHVGQACGGFPDPFDPTCQPQPIRDNASLDVGSIGASAVVAGGNRAALALTALASVASMQMNSNGLANDRRLSNRDGLWGLSVGAEAGWVLFQRLPLAIEASASIGFLTLIQDPQSVDAYIPFYDGFSFRRLRLGLAWCGLAGGQIRNPSRRGCG